MGRWLWTIALSCVAVGLPAHAQLSGITDAIEAGKAAQEAPAAAAPSQEGAAPPTEGGEGQEGAPAEGEAAPPEQPWVSQFCALTFFTSESDSLDLRRSPGEPCFDTGRGRDVFKLDPENFPEGVRVFSDRGRSVLHLSDGPSLVFDQESTAEEIRTGRGDDTIRLGLGFVGTGNPVATPETRVFPGGGNDLVVVGSGLGPAIDARHAANARIFPSWGTIAIEAGCGRPNDPDSLDAIVENAGSDVQMLASVRGCGLALRNHAAPTVIDQDGGRFVALLRPEGEEGQPGGFFSADIRRSSGLNFSALNPRSDTSLVWSGFGDATLQVEARLPQSGGRYAVTADGTIFARVLAHGGSPVWEMASTQGIELWVEGSHTHNVEATLTAPAVVVEWRPQGGEAAPPKVGIVETRDLEARRPSNPTDTSPLSQSVASEEPQGEAEGQEGSGQGAIVQATPDTPTEQVTPASQDAAQEGEGSAEGEQAPAPDAGVVPVEVAVRDALGMTQAGRQAMLEGRPVEMAPELVPNPARWSWDTIPSLVVVDRVEWRIVAPAGWCTTIGVEGGQSQPCAASAVFRLEPGQKLAIGREDGTRVWALSDTRAVDVRWVPAR